jgi:hypothetical protein
MPKTPAAAPLAPADALLRSQPYQAPSHPCGFCGRSAPIQRHFVVGGQRVPVCARCKDRPLGTCTQCGQQAPLYGVRQRVALRCGRCWDRHMGQCPRCGVLAPLLDSDGSTACERCYSVRVRTCGRCGQIRRIKVRGLGGAPDLCERCWKASRGGVVAERIVPNQPALVARVPRLWSSRSASARSLSVLRPPGTCR